MLLTVENEVFLAKIKSLLLTQLIPVEDETSYLRASLITRFPLIISHLGRQNECFERDVGSTKGAKRLNI